MELKFIINYLINRVCCLLIVPYGIEIGIHDRIPISGSLLIVPYGIEIDKSNTRSPDLRAFNRTLWN